MFNFTTQTIYNSIVTTAGDPKRNLWTVSGKKPALRIGNTRFDAENILDILVKRPTVGNYTLVSFNVQGLLSKVTGNDAPNEITGRIVLYVGLSMNCLDALYANNYVYKGKPLYIEFPVKKGDTTVTLTQRIKSIADKYLLMVMGEKILDIGFYSYASTYLGIKFVGVNYYQQIKKAELLWFNPTAKELDCCTNSGDYETIKSGVPAVYITSTENANFGEIQSINNKNYYMDSDGNIVEKLDSDSHLTIIYPGIEPFGDYDWMIHNLRLPTLANTNFWSPTKQMGELPEVGSVYTQIIVRLCKERDGISGEIVGARAKSVTTHVLYVKVEYAKTVLDAFAALSNNIVINQDSDEQLYNPYNLETTTGTASGLTIPKYVPSTNITVKPVPDINATQIGLDDTDISQVSLNPGSDPSVGNDPAPGGNG